MSEIKVRQSEANTAYGIERELLLKNIEALKTALFEKQDADQARTPEYWGHVGNLRQANSDIEDIIMFLEKRSR